jgi:formate hydrogenlyase transcriptional activator
VRVIAATNQVLSQRVEEGAFREDLFFRLHVFPVVLPPLRERREDIPLLADYFLVAAIGHLHKEVTGLSPAALAVLRRYDWPGNVRELKHTVERAVIVCRGETVQAEDITLGIGQKEGPTNGERPSLEEYERQYIWQVLEETGWVIKGPQGAAAVLGMHPATLNSRIKKLGLVRP